MSEQRKRKAMTILNFFEKKKPASGTASTSDDNHNHADLTGLKNTPAPSNISDSFTEHKDICTYKRNSLLNCTDADKEDILKNLWVPDKHFNFPGTIFGNKMRKFNHSWLETFTWLVYSKTEDGAYCKYCFLFSPKQVGNVSSQNVGRLVIHPFKNWKKAVENFQHHQNLQYHRTAVIKADNFFAVSSGKTASIENQVDTARARQIQANQERIIPIIKTVILCGRQGLPLRGHRDTGMFDIDREPDENEGNFRALLRARIDSGDLHLKKHFQICSANATYISWKIQNEILEACDTIIKKKFAMK